MYSFDIFPFQKLIFFYWSILTSVYPLRYHIDSSNIPLKNIFLWVKRGNRLSFTFMVIACPFRDLVGPFLVYWIVPVFIILFTRLIYWTSFEIYLYVLNITFYILNWSCRMKSLSFSGYDSRYIFYWSICDYYGWSIFNISFS